MALNGLSAKRAVVFVHGCWHTGECFGSIRKVVEGRGLTTLAPDLPSVSPPFLGPSDDTATIRTSIAELVEQGGYEVVVFTHSNGTKYAPEVGRLPKGDTATAVAMFGQSQPAVIA